MKALIRLCRCNRLICAFDVRKDIKHVFLWPGSIYFLLPPGVGKRGTCSPPPPPPTSRHCRIMNDFFFAFGGLVGGGGGHGNLPPSLPLPHPVHIYLCRCGGWRDRQVIQDSAWLALVIIKLTGIIFAALKLPAYKAEGFICFGVLRPSQHYLGYFWASQFT